MQSRATSGSGLVAHVVARLMARTCRCAYRPQWLSSTLEVREMPLDDSVSYLLALSGGGGSQKTNQHAKRY